jgi:predicted RNA-binding Zn-ribbon protein involved in translation (DUF1610 family)
MPLENTKQRAHTSDILCVVIREYEKEFIFTGKITKNVTYVEFQCPTCGLTKSYPKRDHISIPWCNGLVIMGGM